MVMKSLKAAGASVSTTVTTRHGTLLVVLVLALAGCRSYGRYDAQEKMLPELRQSVQLFASDLERARSAQDLLRQAATGDSSLDRVADEYGQAVERHAAILDENEQILDRFVEDLPDYRTTHRTFGAVLSEHRAARNRYRSLIKAVRYPGSTPSTRGRSTDSSRTRPSRHPRMRDETFTEGRYYVAPIFYERLQSAGNDMTMRQALAEREQRPAPGRREDGSLSLSTGRPSASADTAGRTR
jgi:hypothetical protein